MGYDDVDCCQAMQEASLTHTTVRRGPTMDTRNPAWPQVP